MTVLGGRCGVVHWILPSCSVICDDWAIPDSWGRLTCIRLPRCKLHSTKVFSFVYKQHLTQTFHFMLSWLNGKVWKVWDSLILLQLEVGCGGDLRSGRRPRRNFVVWQLWLMWLWSHQFLGFIYQGLFTMLRHSDATAKTPRDPYRHLPYTACCHG